MIVNTPPSTPRAMAMIPTLRLLPNRIDANANFSPPPWSRPCLKTSSSCSGVEPGERTSPGIISAYAARGSCIEAKYPSSAPAIKRTAEAA